MRVRVKEIKRERERRLGSLGSGNIVRGLILAIPAAWMLFINLRMWRHLPLKTRQLMRRTEMGHTERWQIGKVFSKTVCMYARDDIYDFAGNFRMFKFCFFCMCVLVLMKMAHDSLFCGLLFDRAKLRFDCGI